jgi:hypothetical protein
LAKFSFILANINTVPHTKEIYNLILQIPSKISITK